MRQSSQSKRIGRPTSVQQSQSKDVVRFKRILRQHLPELRETYHIRALGLFGSYVRGQAQKQSDLDILVEFDEAPSFFQFIELEEQLAALLGVEVDLVMKSALRPAIGQRILREVEPL